MRRVLFAFLFFALFTPVLPADDEDQGPPERAVARISLINGDVSVRRGDSGDVIAAVVNAPITVEDRLLTASSSRAEIQFDSSNMLRIGSNAEVRVGDLQYRRYQIQLALGTVTFRVLRASEAQIELDTPILGIRPVQPGIYRVTVREDGSTDITVREGEAEISTKRGSERLDAGSTMLVRGSVEDPDFQIAAEFGPDEWDRWNSNRDRDMERSPSRQYVSPDVYGTEDLDQHGRWVQDSQYGAVWAPTVAPGWAPYQSGRWVWEDYYGWTWVSYDPWGWAPYHYGRWFYGSAGWCWFPGSIHSRHYWSPALVGFFGFGGRVGVGFGFGNVGWVPLAPYESFRPWWGRGSYGNRNATIINNVNVVNTYRNSRAFNGVTSVNSANFGRRSGQFVSLSGNAIRDAGAVRGALPVTPDRSSLRYSDRQVQSSAYRQSNTRQFYGNASTSSRSVSQPSTVGGSHGWQRFGEPVHGVGSAAVGGTSSYSGGGWQRFGGTAATASSPRQQYSTPSGRNFQSSPAQPTPARYNASPQYSSGRNYQAPAAQPAPRYQSSPRSFGGNTGGSGGGQAVRISPSIVHERSSAPASHSSGGGDRGSNSGNHGRH